MIKWKKPICMIVVACMIAGCGKTNVANGNRQESDSNQSESVRTDLEPLKKLLALDNMESAYWEGYQLGDSSRFDGLGPSTVEMKGFLILDSENAQNYWESYEWEETEADFSVRYLDLSEYEGRTWYSCKAFEEEVINDIYFSQELLFDGNTLWFDFIQD